MIPEIKYCPGTLAAKFNTYSRTCLKRLFSGHKLSHILPYSSASSALNNSTLELFEQNSLLLSFSGVQEKFSLIQEKNKLRLTIAGESGTHILKPIPSLVKNSHQMPANEHLTMQIAQQVFGMETAENALIFFSSGEPAYITKRFDFSGEGDKLGQDDFASLAGKTPQSHGADYKYQGSYLDMFETMKKYLPAYRLESIKLFQQLIFNYLFSNGDAHLKNFSVITTHLGDYRLSPAYDLLNTRMHIADKDFALEQGLLPPQLAKGKIGKQFLWLANEVGILEKNALLILKSMIDKSDRVSLFIQASFLNERMKKNYLQAYQTRLKTLI